jgi:hypothetical protein
MEQNCSKLNLCFKQNARATQLGLKKLINIQHIHETNTTNTLKFKTTQYQQDHTQIRLISPAGAHAAS